MEFEKSQKSAKETDKQQSNSEEILQHEAIEGTPFTAIRYDDQWFLTLGKYRLSEPVKTKEEVLEDAKDASWFRIMQIVKIMIAEHEEDKKIQETITNQQTLKFN